MISLIFLSLAVICVGSDVHAAYDHKKVVCFWNSTSFERQGRGKFYIDHLQPALTYCTHLVYGYAGINATDYEVIPLHPNLDTGAGYAFYRLVTQLKKDFPILKVYLSIGGNADPYEKTHKYLTVIENPETRTTFINSIGRLLSKYDFDGIDLAWQFPSIKIKKNRGSFRSVLHGINKISGKSEFKDANKTEHRNGFTSLVRDLKTQLRFKNKSLTITVLPHVNASIYYDAELLAPNIDAVHLMAFDQKTPERNPKEADYPAPIYKIYGRDAKDNIDSFVRYWLVHGTPGDKIVVGISTFARTWKLTSKSQISGVPPIIADGPGPEGPHTRNPGILSYTEVCAYFTMSRHGRLSIENNPSKNYGSYAFQHYDPVTGVDGIWIGFEDPDTAANKASYVKAKGLGGIAIFDLSTDDFRGICTGDKFPIVYAVKNRI